VCSLGSAFSFLFFLLDLTVGCFPFSASSCHLFGYSFVLHAWNILLLCWSSYRLFCLSDAGPSPFFFPRCFSLFFLFLHLACRPHPFAPFPIFFWGTLKFTILYPFHVVFLPLDSLSPSFSPPLPPSLICPDLPTVSVHPQPNSMVARSHLSCFFTAFLPQLLFLLFPFSPFFLPWLLYCRVRSDTIVFVFLFK